MIWGEEHCRQNKQPVQGPWAQSVAGLLEGQGFLNGCRGMNKRRRRVGQSQHKARSAGPYTAQLGFLLLPRVSWQGKEGFEQGHDVV